MKIKPRLVFKFVTIMAIIIAVLFLLTNLYHINLEDDNGTKSSSPFPSYDITVNFNNNTNEYWFELGPLRDYRSKIIEGAQVSIYFKNITTSSFSDSNGIIIIKIPKDSVSIDELNTRVDVKIVAEGYEDLETMIYLTYQE